TARSPDASTAEVVGDERHRGDEREDREEEENDFPECNRGRCRALAFDLELVQPLEAAAVMTFTHASTVRPGRCGLSYPRGNELPRCSHRARRSRNRGARAGRGTDRGPPGGRLAAA